MSQAFRALLQKVGSGRHTSEPLTRSEAADAAYLMLTQEATPAQIGAFMIAHRIKRPTAEELAGFLDTYDKLGPKLETISTEYPVMVFGVPYDGRTRTSPVQPLIALMLSAVGCPVISHGAERMPTKYGIPLIEIWRALGVEWGGLSLKAIQQVFLQTGQGFIHLPDHFVEAQSLVPYREQIGKRPPLATLELMWCPYEGECQMVLGYVHPPTEELAQKTLTLKNRPNFITIKGLEGSSDLPRARTAIIGVHKQPDQQRFLLHARDYQLSSPLETALKQDYFSVIKSTLQGEPTELRSAVVWNGGFHLWQSGASPTLEAGIQQAKELLSSGLIENQRISLAKEIAHNRQ